MISFESFKGFSDVREKIVLFARNTFCSHFMLVLAVMPAAISDLLWQPCDGSSSHNRRRNVIATVRDFGYPRFYEKKCYQNFLLRCETFRSKNFVSISLKQIRVSYNLQAQICYETTNETRDTMWCPKWRGFD